MKRGASTIKYLLFVDKDKKIIKLTKAVKILENLDYTDEVKRYNQNYWYSCNRKKLRDFGECCKSSWLQELAKEIEEIKEIKI